MNGLKCESAQINARLQRDVVDGGIFSTPGVVVGIAGAWAWLSFAAAGLIALAAGYSYVKLATHYDEGGGAFTFLRDINADGFAGSLSWVLIVGYILTNEWCQILNSE